MKAKYTPERRTPGRPKAAEPSIRVSTWIPVSRFDALAKYGRTHDKKLSALVRESLERFPPK